MNRAGWLQDRRMKKFRDVLSRWERKELSGLEAGELLGVSERQFRRYRDRYEEDGLAGLADKRLGKALRCGGAGGRDRLDARSVPQPVLGLEREALSRAPAKAPWVQLGLHLGEDAAACGGAGGAGKAARSPTGASGRGSRARA